MISTGNRDPERSLGTKTTRAAELPKFEAAVDLRFSELRELWGLADDSLRDEILDAVRSACLRTAKGGAL